MIPSRWLSTLLIVLIIFLSLNGCAFADEASDTLQEVNERFTYNSEPIHPKLLYEFAPWVSDRVPPIVTRVNVSAAFGTNEYYPGEVTHEEDSARISAPVGDGNRFAYEHVATKGDLHVLRTFSSGAGSGSFQALVFVRFCEEEAYDADGMGMSEQLFMEAERRVVLGDRDTAEITMMDDSVVVGPSQYRDKKQVLSFNESEGCK